MRIALVGDYSAAAKAHLAIPHALTLAAADGRRCEWDWLHTSTLGDDAAAQLRHYDGIWCVPGSPYANARGAIAAIRFARCAGRPFLGTCGGFQHALLEYAEAVWGVASPAHAETDPSSADAMITPLACSLVEVGGEVFFESGSRLAAIYAAGSFTEGYHCSYGVNPRYAAKFETGPLRIVARDADGDIRAVELDRHPFFFGTLYQPERSAFDGRQHPLIAAFVAACSEAPARATSP